MFIQKIKFLLIIFFTSTFTPFSVAADFTDGFESAGKLSTNTDGFSWDPNSTLVDIVNTTDSFSGSYSMRFSYPAGTAWAEQRFNTGTPHTDLWISYWIQVPTNFTHTTNGNINKFLAIWSDGYSQHGDGSTVWLLLQRDGNGGSVLSYSYSQGGNNTSGPINQTVPFISPSDRDRWMHIAINVKNESSEGANDGIIRTYRKWASEANYALLHEDLNAGLKIPSSGPTGFQNGYILGWADAFYDSLTEWLVDDFSQSTSPPVGINVTSIVPPMPPSSIRVEIN